MNQDKQISRPTVVVWYKIYCVFMAVGYILFSIYIAFLIYVPKKQLVSQEQAAGKFVYALEHLWGGLLAGTTMLTLFFLVAPFLPRKPWVWIYGIFAISIGLPNCCCLPLSIPLLVLWFRPETKMYFGYNPR